MFMNFFLLVKLISMFRFVSVYYGELLERFLSAGGEILEPKSAWHKDLIQRNHVGQRRKFSSYNKSITMVDSFHYRTIFFFFSFILKQVEKIIIFVMKKKENINKGFFFFIWIHNRVHFFILNLFLSGGVLLNTRTLLHMKLNPETWAFLADKILALLVFFFYWIDIIEMFVISSKYVRLKKDD